MSRRSAVVREEQDLSVRRPRTWRMVPSPCRQALFGSTAVRHPPEDISRAGACRPIRQPFSIRCPDGKLVASLGYESGGVTSREVVDPHIDFAPGSHEGHLLTIWAIPAVSRTDDLVPCSGSAFPCRSTQTSVRSSKSERPPHTPTTRCRTTYSARLPHPTGFPRQRRQAGRLRPEGASDRMARPPTSPSRSERRRDDRSGRSSPSLPAPACAVHRSTHAAPAPATHQTPGRCET